MDNRENLQGEYDQLAQTARHYSNLRFAMLTVFLALVGVLVSFDSSAIDQFRFYSIRIGGLISTLVFWMFEYRLEVYMAHFERRFEHLERKLGYNVYTGRKEGGIRLIRTPFAVRILFLAVTIFWVLSLFASA